MQTLRGQALDRFADMLWKFKPRSEVVFTNCKWLHCIQKQSIVRELLSSYFQQPVNKRARQTRNITKKNTKLKVLLNIQFKLDKLF